MFQSTKTYGTNLGLSASFRQWRARSHCNLIHGYALELKLIFAASELDDRGWVVDFGSLKPLKAKFEEMFDHSLIVAGDDPELEWFKAAHERGIARVVILPDGVGCEKFAKLVYAMTTSWLEQAGYFPRCHLVSAEVREHGANSAIYSKFES